MYTNDRNAYRKAFVTAWYKYQHKMPVEPYEAEIINVLLAHPEYQIFLDDAYAKQEFAVEENPFVHLSLHLAIREQIRMNRPTGITPIYEQLTTISDEGASSHEAEHRMMECLAQMMWTAQQNGFMPGEDEYLGKLQQLLG